MRLLPTVMVLSFFQPAQVLLRLHEDKLLAGEVLEHDLVEAARAHGRVALPRAARLVVRQLVGHPLGAVVDPADDDGLIRIAVEKPDEHLLADAREGDHAIANSGPSLTDTDPAGALVVARSLAIPGKLHAHPAQLVRVDLLTCGADDGGALHARDIGPRREPLRAIRLLGEERDPGHLPDVVDGALQGKFGDEELGRLGQIGVRMTADEEGAARRQVDGIGREGDVALVGASALERALGELDTVLEVMARDALVVGCWSVAALATLDQERPGKIVVLLVPVLGRGGLLGLSEQAESRVAQVVIAVEEAARADLVGDSHFCHELQLCRLVRLVDVRQRRSETWDGEMQRVGEHQRRAGNGVVGEGEGDACLLEEAAEKGEVALTVLDLEFELGVARAIDAPLRRDGPLVEDFVGDVGDREVLEDAVIAPVIEQPEGGREAQVVGRQAGRLRLDLLDEAAHPRPFPGAGERELHPAHDVERRRLADERLEVEKRARRARPDARQKERRDPLPDGEPPDRERVLAGSKRKLDLPHAVAPSGAARRTARRERPAAYTQRGPRWKSRGEVIAKCDAGRLAHLGAGSVVVYGAMAGAVVGSMAVVTPSRVPVGSLVWQRAPDVWAATIVAKATFTLGPGMAGMAAEQEPLWAAEQPYRDGSSRGVHAPSDLVPMKTRADVVLVGQAAAPQGRAVRSLQVRLAVGAIDKRLDLLVNRVLEVDGTVREGGPFAQMPLVYERAAGGPTTVNPLGKSAAGDLRQSQSAPGRLALPNIRIAGSPESAAPGQPPWHEPEGFGPIAGVWPSRQALLGTPAPAMPVEWQGQVMPAQIDLGFFNAAPRDQQLRELRGDEQIVLENMHPEHARCVVTLPGVKPRAFIETATGVEPLPMRCDSLWIDTTRWICTLTWRGARPLESLAHSVVVIALELPGRPLTWEDVDRMRRRSASAELSGTPKAESTRPPKQSSGTAEFSITAPSGAANPLPFAPRGPSQSAATFEPAIAPLAISPLAAPPLATPPLTTPPLAAPPLATQPLATQPLATQPLATPSLVAPPPPEPVAATTAASPWSRGGAAVPSFLAGQLRAAEPVWVRPEEVPAAPSAAPIARSPQPSVKRDLRQAPSTEAVQLVWYAADQVTAARRTPAFGDVLDALYDEPLDAELDDPDAADDPAELEDRREVLEILARGIPVAGERLAAWIAEAVCEDGRFLPPIALVAGELEIELDAFETLEATLSAAAPSAGVDPRAREVLELAKVYLASPGVPGSPSVAEGLAARIRETFDRAALLTDRYLRAQVERALLERRSVRRVAVLGAPHACALLHAGGEPVPVYLPEPLAAKLPATVRMRVRLLARVLPAIDADERNPVALLPIALAHVTKR